MTVLAILLLLFVLFAIIRYRLRDMPLERDEGEYAYSGQLLLEGIPPYQLAYNMKLPGIYAAYAALLWSFGQTPAGIHLGLILINAATLLVIYLLAACLHGRLAGLIAASSWALLSTSASVRGFEAHASHFVVLPAMLGILVLLGAPLRPDFGLSGISSAGNYGRLFLSGVLLGISFLMKQHAIFFVLFCLLWLFLLSRMQANRISWFLPRGAIFSAGVALPYAITCILLYRANVFPQFWFWTVSYAGEYSKIGVRRAIHAFFENGSGVIAPAIPIWLLAAFGLTSLWWSEKARRHRGFLALLLLCSFLSLCPGGYFRPHYFIQILPAVAILAGVGIRAATEKIAQYSPPWRIVMLPTLTFSLFFVLAFWHQRRDFFFASPQDVLASEYPGSPFLAVFKVADYVKTHTTPADRIAVIGSEPEIYFYSQRHSATGYLYMYSLIVHHKYTERMREEFFQDLERNRPLYLVYVDLWDSWGDRIGVAQAKPFLARLQKYMDDNYEKVGIADIATPAQYVWDQAVRSYRPRSTEVIYILRRKSREL